tara:strand:- start:6239 stop:6940 length:702 start_codon:yes stop_codon:yes gene_type:complete
MLCFTRPLFDIERLIKDQTEYFGGPRTKLYGHHLYKIYLPYSKEEIIDEAIIGLHVELEDTVNHYFKTYAGQSHSRMAEWNSYTQVSRKPLLFPYINQTEKGETMNDYFNGFFAEHQKTYHFVSVMSWSKGVPLLLNELTKQELNIEKAYLISSWLLPEKMESFVTANRISSVNPNTSFTFIHGREDTDIPYTDVELWYEQLQQNGLNATLKIIPYSSHWTYWHSPEKLLLIN